MSAPDPDVINHYREAESTLEVIEFAIGAQTSQSYAEYALAEATLALAYEQRTANLIALWGNPQAQTEDSRGNLVAYGLNDTTIGNILQTITERLDLA